MPQILLSKLFEMIFCKHSDLKRAGVICTISWGGRETGLWNVDCTLLESLFCLLYSIFAFCSFGFVFSNWALEGKLLETFPCILEAISHIFLCSFFLLMLFFYLHFKASTLICKFLGIIFVCVFNILISFCFLVASLE